jgi:hypothetical protein
MTGETTGAEGLKPELCLRKWDRMFNQVSIILTRSPEGVDDHVALERGIKAFVHALASPTPSPREQANTSADHVKKSPESERVQALEEALCQAEANFEDAVHCLSQVAKPEYGIGFNGLRGIARKWLVKRKLGPYALALLTPEQSHG